MKTLGALVVVAMAGLVGCAGGQAADDEAQTSDLVGGKRDLRFAAVGYLTHADDGRFDAASPAVACGATLVAPKVVVTAAHCVLAKPKGAWAFGTGDPGRAVTKVAEVHVHPRFHAEAQGPIDVTHALRNFDVAVLVLEREVQGVKPARLPEVAPKMDDKLTALGYSARPSSKRRSTPARVMFGIDLAGDPIFEVHPERDSALCVADGDEGSAVVSGTDADPVLVGFYVGSVTQGFTDCVRGAQFLDGYESAYGYRDFITGAIGAR